MIWSLNQIYLMTFGSVQVRLTVRCPVVPMVTEGSLALFLTTDLNTNSVFLRKSCDAVFMF